MQMDSHFFFLKGFNCQWLFPFIVFVISFYYVDLLEVFGEKNSETTHPDGLKFLKCLLLIGQEAFRVFFYKFILPSNDAIKILVLFFASSALTQGKIV